MCMIIIRKKQGYIFNAIKTMKYAYTIRKKM